MLCNFCHIPSEGDIEDKNRPLLIGTYYFVCDKCISSPPLDLKSIHAQHIMKDLDSHKSMYNLVKEESDDVDDVKVGNESENVLTESLFNVILNDGISGIEKIMDESIAKLKEDAKESKKKPTKKADIKTEKIKKRTL